MKIRHKWGNKVSLSGEKAICLKCGIIKQSHGWVGGFVYHFEKDDFYFRKTPNCGEKMEKQMLKDAKIQHYKKTENFFPSLTKNK